MFSPETIILLLNAGWKANRSVDTTNFKKCLLRVGYPWLIQVQDFLSEFGKLEIIVPAVDSVSVKLFHFDVCKAVADIDSRWIIEDYTDRLRNKKLCVIGQAFSSHLTLIMDDKGKIYGGFDDLLYLVGNNKYDAIEAMCSQKSLAEIE